MPPSTATFVGNGCSKKSLWKDIRKCEQLETDNVRWESERSVHVLFDAQCFIFLISMRVFLVAFSRGNRCLELSFRLITKYIARMFVKLTSFTIWSHFCIATCITCYDNEFCLHSITNTTENNCAHSVN